jgi:ABC-type phosphate transport system auxiliary subunit
MEEMMELVKAMQEIQETQVGSLASQIEAIQEKKKQTPN